MFTKQGSIMPSQTPTEGKNKLLSHTGLPHLIVASLILLIIWVTESIISSIGDEAEIITIKSELNDDFELDIQQTDLETHLLETVDDLLEKIANRSHSIEQIKKLEVIQQLGIVEKQQVLAHLARSLIEQKDYDNSVTLLNSFSIQDRTALDLQFGYAFSLSANGNVEDAQLAYLKVLESKPNHQAAALNLGLLQKKNGQCKEAIKSLTHVIEISSGQKLAKAYAARAGCYSEVKDHVNAVSDYRKSIEYRPTHELTWRLFARSLGYTEEPYDNKLASFEKAIALNKKHYRFHLQKAQFHLDHHDTTRAIETLKEAKSLSRDNLEARRLLAWAYLEVNKRHSARKQLRYLESRELAKNKKQLINYLSKYNNKEYSELQAILKRIKIKSPELNYLAALVNIKTRYYKRALKHLDNLSDHPDFTGRALIQKAKIYRFRKNYETALTLYQQVTFRNESASAVWYEISRIWAKQENYEKALEILQVALEIKPTERKFLLAKGNYLQQRNSVKDSISVLEQLIVDHPRYVRGYRLLGDIYVSAGDMESAITIFEKLLEIKPTDESTLYQLATLYLDKKEHQSAQDLLQRLLAERTDNIDARFLLASSYCELDHTNACEKELDRVLKLNSTHSGAVDLKQKRLSITLLNQNSNDGK
ncbi:MAG: tetratricopeptide repeat protein [Candidatus Thiodiazotropha taylori]